VCVWLWFTVLFANFSEALAEGRGKAQAEALRRTCQQTPVKRLRKPQHNAAVDTISSAEQRLGDHYPVGAGDILPADGEAVEGIASASSS
jgi:potassium-transporting ATPase ATP-binding subunit